MQMQRTLPSVGEITCKNPCPAHRKKLTTIMILSIGQRKKLLSPRRKSVVTAMKRGCVKTVDTPSIHSNRVILSKAKNLIISTR